MPATLVPIIVDEKYLCKLSNPCFWLDDQAEAATYFYFSVFKTSKIINTARYLEGVLKLAGSVMTVEFILDGQELQVVPNALPAMFSGTDTAAGQRAFCAMTQMKKRDIAMLERACNHA